MEQTINSIELDRQFFETTLIQKDKNSSNPLMECVYLLGEFAVVNYERAGKKNNTTAINIELKNGNYIVHFEITVLEKQELGDE